MPYAALRRLLVQVPLLAACASPVPETSFADPEAIEHAIEAYYERHASERNQSCQKPYIDGLTRVTVVDQQPDRLVLDARYLYRDRFKDERHGGMDQCTSYAEREFTLEKNDAGLQVVGMSESRPQP